MLAGCSLHPGGHAGPTLGRQEDRLAVQAAARFLHTYLDPSGRVVRRDQGGDTVSEGQAYALLLSVAIGDRASFERVWTWTRQHLQRTDGLLGFHWQNGHLVDATPAADADVQTAWALTLAGRRFDRPDLTAEARRLAGAIVTTEIGYDDRGRVTLAAGPWAIRPAQPIVAEPGYWTPPAYAALAALTGDGRWKALTASDLDHLRVLTRGGLGLPPDWALLSHGAARPSASPDGKSAPQNGPDGMRATIWAGCTRQGRRAVARGWPALAASATQAPLVRGLDGVVRDANRVPLSAVAAAAAAQAAGESGASSALLRTADEISAQFPSYYGDAWNALGRVLLTTQRLATCR
ncbi:MAG: glycoside hydrolase family 8 [Frankiales bacterium]|nr:glycoside hydrolase family 8 [Frankiales bacterium]